MGIFEATRPYPIKGTKLTSRASSVEEGNFRRTSMPDDKTKVGEPDRSRVSADQDYEIRQLAEKHGLSPTQIRELIARVGNDRAKLEEEAQKLRRS
jgi:Protein of unknown function (DUF3606)